MRGWQPRIGLFFSDRLLRFVGRRVTLIVGICLLFRGRYDWFPTRRRFNVWSGEGEGAPASKYVVYLVCESKFQKNETRVSADGRPTVHSKK